MNYDKIRRNCRVIRIVAGAALMGTGFITGNAWFYLGVLPLIAGIVNFCPLCIISKSALSNRDSSLTLALTPMGYNFILLISEP